MSWKEKGMAIDQFGLVGNSPEMLRVKSMIEKVAPHNTPVLIEGESGTGKELVARAIHFNSPRKKNEFVVINCSAFPDTLLESELFGHMRGSFTGAISEKKGLFQIADQGTFFLDEVGEMSPALQVKLLRVLQESEFLKIGGVTPVKVDVRIIAATNRNLEQYVKEKKFRDDLFFRLNVLRIELPSLKQRAGDIPFLVEHILKRVVAKNDVSIKKVSPGAMNVLKQYEWRGNVRELENELEKACIMSEGDLIEEKHLSNLIKKCENAAEKTPSQSSPQSATSLKQRKKALVANLEIEMIRESLVRNKNNQTKTAHELEISRQELIRKIKQYGLLNSPKM